MQLTRSTFVPALLVAALAIGSGFVHAAAAAEEAQGTVADPIVDSEMTEAEAFAGIDPGCPAEIRNQQKLIEVLYYSYDGKVHRGQLVIDRDLERDLRTVFEAAFEEEFPIQSVIPVSHPKFRKDGRWDDGLTMAANNTSAFNYRRITGGTQLSNHAYGRAIDINPLDNPYIRGNLVLPPGAIYDPNAAGAIRADSGITRAFLDLGWEWGGTWESRKDYQHFEKPLRSRP